MNELMPNKLLLNYVFYSSETWYEFDKLIIIPTLFYFQLPFYSHRYIGHMVSDTTVRLCYCKLGFMFTVSLIDFFFLFALSDGQHGRILCCNAI